MMIFNYKEKIVERIEALESSSRNSDSLHKECAIKHDLNAEHRRRIDDKIDDLLFTVREILDVIKVHAPTMERATKNFTAMDMLKEWALWIAAIGGAVSIIYHLIT